MCEAPLPLRCNNRAIDLDEVLLFEVVVGGTTPPSKVQKPCRVASEFCIVDA